MLCPKDLTPMEVAKYKDRQIVGGKSSDKLYETWSVLVCPTCFRLVHEFYSAWQLESKTELAKFYNEITE